MNNPPILTPHGQTKATTYYFRNDHGFGWALCTVNDATGELTVCSDWGNFTYLWSARPDHLGAPTLTHFIAYRNADGCHYLADKLTSDDRNKRQRFDPRATVQSMQEDLVQRRKDGDLTGREMARLYKELTELLTHDVEDERDFVDAFYRIEDHERIANEPWECFRHVLTSAYTVLLKSILPALVAACDRTIIDRALAVGATAALLGAHA